MNDWSFLFKNIKMSSIIKLGNVSINVSEAIKLGEDAFKKALKGNSNFDLNKAWEAIVKLNGVSEENTSVSVKVKKGGRYKKADEGSV